MAKMYKRQTTEQFLTQKHVHDCANIMLSNVINWPMNDYSTTLIQHADYAVNISSLLWHRDLILTSIVLWVVCGGAAHGGTQNFKMIYFNCVMDKLFK